MLFDNVLCSAVYSVGIVNQWLQEKENKLLLKVHVFMILSLEKILHLFLEKNVTVDLWNSLWKYQFTSTAE